MKIIFKTLTGKQFDLEVEETDTVASIKGRIEEKKKADGESFPAADQKLVILGKIMEDDKTLQSYNVKEGNFIVVMVQKPVVKKVD